MVEIHSQRNGGGHRTAIRHGRHISVIDGNFGGAEDMRTGQPVSPVSTEPGT